MSPSKWTLCVVKWKWPEEWTAALRLFSCLPCLKADWTEMEAGPQKKKPEPRTNQQRICSYNMVRYERFVYFIFTRSKQQVMCSRWTGIQLRLFSCCCFIRFPKICGFAKDTYFSHHAVLYNKIQILRREIITSSASPPPDPCFSVSGLCHAWNPPLLSRAPSWETFHTTIAAAVRVAIWMPCAVFLLAMGAVFGSQT